MIFVVRWLIFLYLNVFWLLYILLGWAWHFLCDGKVPKLLWCTRRNLQYFNVFQNLDEWHIASHIFLPSLACCYDMFMIIYITTDLHWFSTIDLSFGLSSMHLGWIHGGVTALSWGSNRKISSWHGHETCRTILLDIHRRSHLDAVRNVVTAWMVQRGTPFLPKNDKSLMVSGSSMMFNVLFWNELMLGTPRCHLKFGSLSNFSGCQKPYCVEVLNQTLVKCNLNKRRILEL